MVKGFNYRLHEEDLTLVLTNESVSDGVDIFLARANGDFYDLRDMSVLAHMKLTREDFITLAKRLDFEADKLKDQIKKEVKTAKLEIAERPEPKVKKIQKGKKK